MTVYARALGCLAVAKRQDLMTLARMHPHAIGRVATRTGSFQGERVEDGFDELEPDSVTLQLSTESDREK